jgi:NitT/TauT family transport system substrate-binding protein
MPKVRLLSLFGVALALLALASRGRPAFPRPEKLTLGYIPVAFLMHFAAADEKGWFRDDLGVQVEYVSFPTGVPLLQAVAAGEIDIAYIGVGPALTLAHRGVPYKIVAATARDGFGVVAAGKFADIYTRNPTAAAFTEFQRQQGRHLKIASPPKGTNVDIILRLWLTRLGLNPERDVEIVRLAGEEKFIPALVSGAVDAFIFPEPHITLAQRSDPKNQVIWWNQETFPNTVSTVVMVKQSLIDQYPEMMEKLVEIHLRANKLFQEDREYWARVTAKMVGEERLPFDIVRQAINGPGANSVGNPRGAVDAIVLFDQFLVQDGTYPAVIRAENMFDFRFYDRVVLRRPELKDS